MRAKAHLNNRRGVRTSSASSLARRATEGIPGVFRASRNAARGGGGGVIAPRGLLRCALVAPRREGSSGPRHFELPGFSDRRAAGEERRASMVAAQLPAEKQRSVVPQHPQERADRRLLGSGFGAREGPVDPRPDRPEVRFGSGDARVVQQPDERPRPSPERVGQRRVAARGVPAYRPLARDLETRHVLNARGELDHRRRNIHHVGPTIGIEHEVLAPQHLRVPPARPTVADDPVHAVRSDIPHRPPHRSTPTSQREIHRPRRLQTVCPSNTTASPRPRGPARDAPSRTDLRARQLGNPTVGRRGRSRSERPLGPGPDAGAAGRGAGQDRAAAAGPLRLVERVVEPGDVLGESARHELAGARRVEFSIVRGRGVGLQSRQRCAGR